MLDLGRCRVAPTAHAPTLFCILQMPFVCITKCLFSQTEVDSGSRYLEA